MAVAIRLRLSDLSAIFLAVWLLFIIARRASRRSYATPLRGPPRPSFLYGLRQELLPNTEIKVALQYEKWLEEYGGVFAIPWSLGTTKTILADPKAIAHFYARETYTYRQAPLGRNAIGDVFGRGILWAEADVHKRQRKALTPAFSNASIKALTSVFYDSSYKLKGHWDNMIEPEGTVIEVQKWMNSVALDSIGIAGFSHDFGALDGKEAPVANAIDNFGKRNGGKAVVSPFMFIIAPVLPILLKLPLGGTALLRGLRNDLSQIGQNLLQRMKKEKEMGDSDALNAEKSVIGLLIKAEGQDAELYMTPEEIQAQMNVLLLAGYITTSISLTWALIQLSRHKDIQDKLRAELSQFGGKDATWEQLTSGLPYLDAVVHEVLRLHPPLAETVRECFETDIVPLSNPITTQNGDVVTSVTIPKGALVAAPIRLINTSEAFWGPDAKEFRPERWLHLEDGEFKKLPASDIQGHKHLLTFIDGPRTCLGKGFALAEFKAVLSVLIRNYTFELPDGPDTPIEFVRAFLVRPKVAGQEGTNVPLLVKKVE